MPLNATLRYSISNIAWPEDADDEAYSLAAALGYDGVEIAPAKSFGTLEDLTETRVRQFRTDLERYGLTVPAIQAILFGTANMRLFGTASEERSLGQRLGQIARLADWLGAGACVFGAPRHRDRGAMSLRDAEQVARRFFTSVSPLFEERSTCLCFEANPSSYNCNFITHTQEALALVQAVNAPGFRLQFDTGTYFINKEAGSLCGEIVAAAAHFHVSEPNLVPVGTSGSDHAEIGNLLLGSTYSGWVSVEMRPVKHWKDAIKSATLLLERFYGKPR